MAPFRPPGVGEERVSKVPRRTRLKRVLVRPETLKAALKVLEFIDGLIKIVAKVTDWLG
jgi:hypothetical protein